MVLMVFHCSSILSQVATKDDQYSNGGLQYYPQDTVASMKNSTSFIDFTVDPDQGKTLRERLPAIENSVWYHMTGNVAYMGFSGAYEFRDISTLFADACQWISEVDPALVLVVGHWNDAGVSSLAFPWSSPTCTNSYAAVLPHRLGAQTKWMSRPSTTR